MRTFIETTLFAFSITLAATACDSGEAGDAKAEAGEVKAEAGEAKAEAGTPEAAADAGAAEAGDADAEVAEAEPLDPKVEKAVTLANDIAATPANADTILEAAGMDRESFEALLYEIAKDPDLSKSYAIAREA